MRDFGFRFRDEGLFRVQGFLGFRDEASGIRVYDFKDERVER